MNQSFDLMDLRHLVDEVFATNPGHKASVLCDTRSDQIICFIEGPNAEALIKTLNRELEETNVIFEAEEFRKINN